MLKKHRKTGSLPLLCCGETKSFQPALALVDRKSIKAQKISLKQFVPNKSYLEKPLLHKKSIKQDKIIQFQNKHPKILFTYASPKNLQYLKNTHQPIVPEKIQFQPKIYLKKTPEVKKMSNQQDSRITVPNRIYHRSNNSELELQKSEQKTNTFERQKEEIHSLRTQKMKQYVTCEEESKTVNYQKQENKNRIGLQTELNYEQSLLLKQNSQMSQLGSSHRKSNQFFITENFSGTMKNCKILNNFKTTDELVQRKQKHLNNRTVQLNREVYKKGKLFEKVRRLQTKFSDNDNQSSSSHHSEVIQDYKSLLVKLQSNKLQDQQLRQI